MHKILILLITSFHKLSISHENGNSLQAFVPSQAHLLSGVLPTLYGHVNILGYRITPACCSSLELFTMMDCNRVL